VVGTIVPGSTLIIGLSAVATGAHANPWILLIAAITGAIIGDGLSFWLGQRYHREILSSWPLNQLQRMAGAVGSAVKGDLSLLMIGWVACQVRYVHAVSVGLRLMAVSDPCPYLGPRPDALDCAIASPN
jgi:membrane protein YqaA with SNARE-associated domain